MRQTILLFVIMAIVAGPSIAVAGSIKTFHRSWTHAGYNYRSEKPESTVAKHGTVKSTVVENTAPVTKAIPVTSKTSPSSTKSSGTTVNKTTEATKNVNGYRPSVAVEAN